jgi:3D (Asp-Asp-Asp) domain-containing protein
VTRRARRGAPPAFAIAGWLCVALVVAIGQAADSEPSVIRGTEETSLAHPPVYVRAELEHAPVRVVATPPVDSPAAPTRTRPPLPRPFAGLRPFGSPLIMPRLKLPRVLTPRLAELSSAFARARPGEPVAVTLTAYCLRGTTRRGRPVRAGIIAADPRVFPLARHVELFAGGRFLGRFLVDDTGLAVKGAHIDIWTPDCDDARRFGSRRGVATLVASD